MILSAQQLFSDAQALTTTAASTNVIDLGAPGTVKGAPAALVRDIGKSGPIPIVISLDVAAGGTSPTLTVALQMDTTAAFSSATTIQTAPQIAGGSAGQRVAIFWIPEGVTERYIRLNYTLGGTSPTYTVTAGIVLADQTNTTVAGV
jgi:hypothetical protein